MSMAYTNTSILLMQEGCGLATVLHTSPLARVCHTIKLNVMNQACIPEAGANHTPQEEECRILLQGGNELW